MKIMFRTIGSAACLAAALALSASTLHAQNILVDPSFESGAFGQINPIPVPGGVGGGWGAWGASVSTNAALTGTYSALAWNNTWNPQGLYQLLDANPGETYEMFASYMTPDPSLGAGYATPVLVQISYFDNTGTGIGTPAGDWQPLGAANTWVQSPTVSAVAPAGTAYVGAYLMMMNSDGANGFELYFDDASLILVPEPTTFALAGLGTAALLIFRRRR